MKKLEEVFKKSGIPTYTFVEPLEYRKLLVSLRTPGRGLVIEGPSGIGKTTCVLKILEDIGYTDDALILSGRNESDIEYIAELPSLGNIGLVIIDDFHRLDSSISNWSQGLIFDWRHSSEFVKISPTLEGYLGTANIPDTRSTN